MLLHTTFDHIDFFCPRVPSVHTRMIGENSTMPRICVAPTIEQCLAAMPLVGETAWRMQQIGLCVVIHVYELESQNVMSNEEVQRHVPDAKETGEMWILDTPELIGRKDYKLCNVQYKEVIEDGQPYHLMQSYDLAECHLYEDNVENILHKLSIHDKQQRKNCSEMMRECTLQSLLMNMFEEFLDLYKTRVKRRFEYVQEQKRYGLPYFH